MRVDIVEIGHDSHRFLHIKNVYQSLVKLQCDVRLVVTRESLLNPIAVELKKTIGDKCTVINSKFTKMANKRMSFVISQLLSYIIIRKYYKQLPVSDQPDYVFMPMIDDCIHLIGLLGSPFGKAKFLGLSMAQHIKINSSVMNAPAPRGAFVKKLLIKKLLENKKCVCLFSIVKPFCHEISNLYPNITNKIQYVSDPVEKTGVIDKNTSEKLRKLHNIPDGVFIVLVYGAITNRKGLTYLLSAFFNSDKLSNIVVLVCGSIKKSGEKILNSSMSKSLINQKRLFIWNKFLTDEEEQAVFSLCDVVWLGYPKFYVSSGVQLLAASYGKPTVSTKDGLIGWRTKYYKTGAIVNVSKPDDITKKINNFLYNEEFYVNCVKNGRILAKEHKVENFISTINNVILGDN